MLVQCFQYVPTGLADWRPGLSRPRVAAAILRFAGHLPWRGGRRTQSSRTPSGWRVKPTISILTKFLLVLATVVALSSCATRPAPDFGGRWKNINRFAEETQAIPLQDTYLFYASPMDGTLKAMLERWAKDSNMTLAYRHPMDYTLHSAVAEIRTPSLQEAVSQLNAAFAAQQVSVGVSGDEIVVRVSSGSATTP